MAYKLPPFSKKTNKLTKEEQAKKDKELEKNWKKAFGKKK